MSPNNPITSIWLHTWDKTMNLTVWRDKEHKGYYCYNFEKNHDPIERHRRMVFIATRIIQQTQNEINRVVIKREREAAADN